MAKTNKSSTQAKKPAKSAVATKKVVTKKAKAKKAVKKNAKAKKAASTSRQPTTRSAAGRSPKQSAAPSVRKTKKLPDTFSAVTDTASETVTLSGNGHIVGIHMKSFDDVAGILAAMQQTKRLKSSTISIRFSGVPGVKISAQSFPDVANAVSVFGLNTVSDQNQLKPVAAPEDEDVEDTKPTKVARVSEQSKAPKPPKPAKATNANVDDGSVIKTRGRSIRPVEPVNEIPDWFERDFKNEYEYNDPEFSLRRARLALDPKNPKTVLGRWQTPDDLSAWGYEIISADKHVAWVIAKAPRVLIITGVPGLPPSPHSAIVGVIARIASLVIPSFNGTA